jgi:hypothetical protein
MEFSSDAEYKAVIRTEDFGVEEILIDYKRTSLS